MQGEEVTVERVCKEFGFGDRPEDVLNIYLTGSRVYGTAEPDADWDFLLIVQNNYEGAKLHDEDPLLNATIFTEAHFKGMIEDHHFLALYCIFLPEQFKWKETITTEMFLKDWKYDEAKLKRRFFQKSGSSLNRAKVYINKAAELNSQEYLRKGKKMIGHSLRFLHFGLQIVKEGKITDYTIANGYWEEMKGMISLNWKDYEKRFRPIYLELRDRYPEVPVAPFEYPPDVPSHFRTLYQFKHDPACTDINQASFEKEILHIIRTEMPVNSEQDEEQREERTKVFESYFPTHLDTYISLRKDLLSLCKDIQILYDTIMAGFTLPITDKKDFAARVKTCWCAPVIFAMQKDSLTAREYYKAATQDNLVHWVAKHKEHLC